MIPSNMSSKKIELGANSKVNIKWSVLPIEYSRETEENIQVKFANKYGISKDNVKVVPFFITRDTYGNVCAYQNDITNNIQRPEFQRQLFITYINEHQINLNDGDFDEIIKIDDDINSRINYTLYDQNKRYSVNWIKWDNFMSYGEGNYFDFRKVNDLVLLTSEPANQGGKTTFCLDLLRFLLFGKVTSRENDWVVARVFNKHLPEATEVVVEGCVTIDGVDYVIKRTVTRPALKKRTEKSQVKHKVEYYKLVNNEYIELADEECENESTVKETNKAIKEAIGNERDFDLMICVDSDNLKDLISLKDTDRGRLISRWIGLLSLEDKDKIAREKFNKEIMPSLMINKYNKEELRNDVKVLDETNQKLSENIVDNEQKQKEIEKSLESKRIERETLLQSKKQIDENLLKVDVVTLETAIKTNTEEGKKKRSELQSNEEKLKEFGEIKYSEEEYKTLREREQHATEWLANSRVKYTSKKNEIEALKKGEYCPTCGAKLKGVDNSVKIAELEKELESLASIGVDVKNGYDDLKKQISQMEEQRTKQHEKDKLQLLIEKNRADIEILLAKHQEYKRTIKDINDNKAAIENNNKIEIALNLSAQNIKVDEECLSSLTKEITSKKAEIETNSKTIEQYNKIISTIEQEEILVRNWRLYLDMIGKNGVSKMVIRTVLPLINGELMHLLSDVCDFTVEVSIDEHNDVAFSLIHDGVKSALGSGSGFEQTVSSLALRTVLSKISSFSKPSFVVFDEILGGVAAENYDALKSLYDKMVASYGTILEITHNPALIEWHKHFITIKKENNISTIKQIS